MLTQHWQGVVNELVTNLTEAYKGSSGVTRQSIGALNKKPVQVTANGFKISITMPDHYQFLDEGVHGKTSSYAENAGSPFKYTDKMPSIKSIRKFMLNRGITSLSDLKSSGGGNAKLKTTKGQSVRKVRRKNTQSGRKSAVDSQLDAIAFIIARSIFNKGTKASHFYSDAVNDKSIRMFGDKLLKQYEDLVIDLVKK